MIGLLPIRRDAAGCISYLEAARYDANLSFSDFLYDVANDPLH